METATILNSEQLISVIIPIYNRSKLITRTFDSVFNQTHRPIELVLVDDGSTDDSYSKTVEWRDSPRISSDRQFIVRVIRQNNSGAPTARNVGITISTGKYLQFLDSDDLLEPEKLASQFLHLASSKHEIAICDYRYVTEQLDVIRLAFNRGNLALRMAFGWSIYTATPLFTKRFILEYNCLWDEELKINQDIDYNLRALLLSTNVIYTPGIWCNYVQHEGIQISDSHEKRAPQFLRRIRNLLELGHSLKSRSSGKKYLLLYTAIIVLAKDLIKFYIYKIPKMHLKLALISLGLRQERSK